MKNRHSALEYAALLGEYLEKLGLHVAYEINPEYPKWSGIISIAPGEIHCRDIDWAAKLLTSPQLHIDDDGEIRIDYALPIKIEGYAAGEALSADDELRILRILNDNPLPFRLCFHPDRIIMRYSTRCSMSSCSRSCAKNTAAFIRELLYSACIELDHLLPRAYLEPAMQFISSDWENNPFAVRKAGDIAAYVEARLAEMQAASKAAEKRSHHITEWDPAWGDPAEVVLRSKEEYERTGSLSSMIMFNAAADYLLGKLTQSADKK